MRRWLEPIGLCWGEAAAAAVEAGAARWLAGGKVAFALVRLIGEGRVVPVGAVPDAYAGSLRRLTERPPAWAGLPAGRVSVMGIVNVTPDSFSDGGRYLDAEAAIAVARAMVGAGADLVDVGGESTRPGAPATPPGVEQARILPVIRALAADGTVVSADTRNAETMAMALEAGARIINDVSGLAYDAAAAPLLAAHGCPVVLMHMRGVPATMQGLTAYDDVAVDVAIELAARLEFAAAAGISRDRLALDPGIGFAKGPGQNETLLARLGVLLNLGCPLVVGLSRKGFIGRLSGEQDPARRGPGSLAAGLMATLSGASVLRVHDIAETIQAIRVWQGLTGLR
jgi:dihydropteroate synthase